MIVIAIVIEVFWPLASVAVTVKVQVPLPVGVPLISPVLGLIDNPAGKEPSVIANVIGDLPPETFSGSEYGVPVIPSRSVFGVVIAVGTTI